MKKLCIAIGLVILLLLPLFSSISLAGSKKDLSSIEPSAVGDLDFVVLGKSQSISVTANILFPLAFKVIPILVFGEETGAFSAGLSGGISTPGEIVYIYQRFPGVPVSAFNIGITPLSAMNTSSAVTLGPGYAIGYVITGILFAPVAPPYNYRLSLGFN